MPRNAAPRPALSTAVLALLAAVAAGSASAQTVRSAAGSFDTAAAARDAFRADLGGGTDPGAAGSFGGVRREINWDGVSDALSRPNFLPTDFFNLNSPRGALFTNATGLFAVSAKAGNPSATPVRFADFDPDYADLFAAFSPERLFASLGDPVYDVVFLVPGTNRQALVSGFGAMFTDVDIAGRSFIEYFDVDGASLGRFEFQAAAGDQTFSFLGVSFPGAPRVARVRMSAGDVSLLDGGEPAGHDAAAVDDFIYSEPVEAPGAPCVETPTALCLQQGRFRVEATFDSVQAGGGTARVRALTPDSGALSFFSTDNLEALIKVLDGCGLNDRFWVYGSAATDVAFTITVTDTVSGLVRQYSKEQGPPAPAITDNGAFASCDAGN